MGLFGNTPPATGALQAAPSGTGPDPTAASGEQSPAPPAAQLPQDVVAQAAQGFTRANESNWPTYFWDPPQSNTPAPPRDFWREAGQAFTDANNELQPKDLSNLPPPRTALDYAGRAYDNGMNFAKASGLGPMADVSDVMAAGKLLGGLNHAFSGPVGAMISKAGFEAANPDLAMAFSMPFVPRFGPETPQSLAQTQTRAETLGNIESLFLGGGDTAAPRAAEEAPEVANVLSRLANKVTGGALLDPEKQAWGQISNAVQDGLKNASQGGNVPSPAELYDAWQKSGASPGTWADLLSKSGANGNLVGLVRDAASRDFPAAATVGDYLTKTAANLPSNVADLTNALRPGGATAQQLLDGIQNLRQTGGVDPAALDNLEGAIRFAHDNIGKPVADFAAGLQKYGADASSSLGAAVQGAVPVTSTRDAMQIAGRDGLLGQFNRPGGNEELLGQLSGADSSKAMLRTLFGDQGEAYVNGLANALTKRGNARAMAGGFDPAAIAKPDGPVSGALNLAAKSLSGMEGAAAQFAQTYLLKNSLATPQELQKIAQFATQPANLADFAPRLWNTPPAAQALSTAARAATPPVRAVAASAAAQSTAPWWQALFAPPPPQASPPPRRGANPAAARIGP